MGPYDPDPADKKSPSDDLAERRNKLSAELARRSVQAEDRPKKTAGWGEAVKIASEFVAGIVVGVGLGLIFDYAFGTRPFGLVVCLLLGFAAGVLNVLRAQGVVSEAGAKLRGEPPRSGQWSGAPKADEPEDED